MRFYLLGPVEARHGDREAPISRPRQRALLSCLLLNANRPVTTESLIEAMWRGCEPATAHAQIRADIAALRRAFRQVSDQDPIRTVYLGYQIQVEQGELDTDVFADEVDRARSMRAGGDLEQAAATLRQAIARWRGAALGGASGAFLDAARASLDERLLSAVEEHAEVELQLGRGAGLVAPLSELFQQHPLRERLCCALMAALYRAGRQGDALAAGRDLRRALADQLGLDPGPRIIELEKQILQADPVLGAAERPHVNGIEAPAEHGTVPAQLPPCVPDFVGRADHLRWLDSCLDTLHPHAGSGAVPVVAITGIGGVGKTALAIRWAHLARHRFPDGQLFLDLRGFTPGQALTPLAALTVLLRALGVPGDQLPGEIEEAKGLYRTLLQGRQALVVIDNARSADMVRPLLPGHAGCLILITSRDRLSGLVARDGARRLPMDVLPAAESTMLIERILGPERAGRETEATMALADLCGHLPLALRIAVTHLADAPKRTISEYVTRLRDGNRLADFEIDGDSETSITAAFQLSYSALALPAQRLFCLMSDAPCVDFTAASCAALIETSVAEANEILNGLSNAHFVNEYTSCRYIIHDLLRLYGVTQSLEQERQQARHDALSRISRYYLRLTNNAAAQLYPQMLRLPNQDQVAAGTELADHDVAVAWLESERANLVSIVRSATEKDLAAEAIALADALRGFFFTRGYPDDWETVAKAGLLAAQAQGSPHALAAMRMSLAQLYRSRGCHGEALAQHTAALGHAETAGWAEAKSATLGNLGTVHADRGALRESLDCFTKALAINRQIGWRQGQTVNLLNLGLTYRHSGRLGLAKKHYRQADELYRAMGARAGEAITQTNLGEVHHAGGEFEASRQHLDRAITLHRQLGNRAYEGETIRCVAALHADTGAVPEALRQAQLAIDLAQETKHTIFEIEATATLGRIQHVAGELQAALDNQLTALREARRGGMHHLAIDIMVGLAATLLAAGSTNQAQALAMEAISAAHDRGYRSLEGRAHQALALTRLSYQDEASALIHARRAWHCLRRTGQRPDIARALALLGRIQLLVGDGDGSRHSIGRASDLMAAMGVAFGASPWAAA